jgi:hypothetical protein
VLLLLPQRQQDVLLLFVVFTGLRIIISCPYRADKMGGWGRVLSSPELQGMPAGRKLQLELEVEGSTPMVLCSVCAC